NDEAERTRSSNVDLIAHRLVRSDDERPLHPLPQSHRRTAMPMDYLLEQHLVQSHVHVSGMGRIRNQIPFRLMQAVRRHRSASIPDGCGAEANTVDALRDQLPERG